VGILKKKQRRIPMFFGSEIKAELLDSGKKILTVSRERCPQNHPCPSVRVCPVGALKQKGYAAPVVDQEKCMRCEKCVRSCPRRALKMR
jgi:Fe-S-cluster-containing hydrogenase component 2